eukprot:3917217-Pyramimonas_sp.AAC.1
MDSAGGRQWAIAKFGGWIRGQPQFVAKVLELTECRFVCQCGEKWACYAGATLELWTRCASRLEVQGRALREASGSHWYTWQ